jgi:hypothetical protein
VINLTPLVRYTAILTSLILASGSMICINPAQSQQRACVITDEGTTVCGKPTTSKQKQQETTPNKKNTDLSQSVKLDDYIFSLKKCQRFSPGAFCTITIVNNGKERNLKIVANNLSDRSMMIMTDITGKEYSFDAKLVEIGETKDKEITFKPNGGKSYDVVLHFVRIARSTNKAQKLLLPISIDGTLKMVVFNDFILEIFM